MQTWAFVLLLLCPLMIMILLPVALGRLVWLLRRRPRGILTDRPLTLLLLWAGLLWVYAYGLTQGGFFTKDGPEEACGQLAPVDPPVAMSLLPLSYRCNTIGGGTEELVSWIVNPLLLLGVVAIATVHVAGRVRRDRQTR